jgi:hypothetical protein
MTTRKTLEPPEERAAATGGAPEADDADAVDETKADDAFGDTPTSADYSTAFSPRNVAVGLAIVAGLMAFVASRRRKQSGREDG